jgi:hypothetical protein
MKRWLYDYAQCQRWMAESEKTIDILVDETMNHKDP